MQCPACNHDDDHLAFGKPARCPKCEAFYDKAIIARAKRNEALAVASARLERKAKVDSAVNVAGRVVRLLWRWSAKAAFSRPAVISAVAVAIVVAIANRDPVPPSTPTTQPLGKKDSGPNVYAMNRIAQGNVEARLKDADSAKFRGQFIGKSGVACGEVNAKNSFGAYIGFKRYVASGGGLAFIETDMPSDQFQATWLELCAK